MPYLENQIRARFGGYTFSSVEVLVPASVTPAGIVPARIRVSFPLDATLTTFIGPLWSGAVATLPFRLFVQDGAGENVIRDAEATIVSVTPPNGEPGSRADAIVSIEVSV